MSRRLFIINPRAGRGIGAKVARDLPASILRDKSRNDVVYTERRGEATDIARDSGADVIVAVGGDGTVNEVANGILGSDKTLAIIPAGSGNDLIKSLQIPRNVSKALQVLEQGKTRRIDAGRVMWNAVGENRDALGHEHCFLNGIGIGFDAAVAKKASSIKYLRGTFLYLTALLLTVADYSAPLFSLSVDDRVKQTEKKLLIAISNGKCSGGGFYLTPEATLDDGLLDMCAISDVSVSGVLRLIPQVLKANHLGSQHVLYERGREFHVASEAGFMIHADGEVVAQSAASAVVQNLEKAVSVVTVSGISA